MSVEPWIDASCRAAPGCHRPGGRCCRAAVAGSPRYGCIARPPCAGSSRPSSTIAAVRPGPDVAHNAPATSRKDSRRHTTNALDNLRRIAAEMAAKDLEHAARVLQRGVGRRGSRVKLAPCTPAASSAGRRRCRRSPPGRRSLPGLFVVRAAVRGPSQRRARQGLRCPVILVDDRVCVRVGAHVLGRSKLVRPGRSGSRPPRNAMSVPARSGTCMSAHRARAREARVDMDHLRATLLRLDHPLEADGMALRHVRALDHDAVGVLQVLLEGGCPTAAERRPQTGDGRGVSYAAWFSSWIAPSAVNSS